MSIPTAAWSRCVTRSICRRSWTTGSTSCHRPRADALKGIFCAQVVEHLITPEMEELIRQSHRTLRKGGVLVIETINPRSSFALGNHFYADTSHVRPVHPETLRFICEQIGFTSVQLEERSPHPSLTLGRGASRWSTRAGSRRPARERLRLPGLRDRRYKVKRFTAVHQFHSGTALGDAITNQMLRLQQLLQEMGYHSEIFAEHVAPELQHRIHSIFGYLGSDSELLVVHHSIGYDAFDDVIGLPNEIVTIYHNVTPERYFADPHVKRFIRLGREQLALWRAGLDSGSPTRTSIVARCSRWDSGGSTCFR